MNELDELDIAILEILEKDARVSYRKIHEKLNISVGTVHNRLSKLKQKGILKEQAFLLNLNEKKLGYELKFQILIAIDGKHTDEVLKQLGKYPEVTTIYHLLGENSASVICRFKHMQEVQDFIRKLNHIPHVKKTTSNMILNIYKEDEHHVISAMKKQENQKPEEFEIKNFQHFQDTI